MVCPSLCRDPQRSEGAALLRRPGNAAQAAPGDHSPLKPAGSARRVLQRRHSVGSGAAKGWEGFTRGPQAVTTAPGHRRSAACFQQH